LARNGHRRNLLRPANKGATVRAAKTAGTARAVAHLIAAIAGLSDDLRAPVVKDQAGRAHRQAVLPVDPVESDGSLRAIVDRGRAEAATIAAVRAKAEATRVAASDSSMAARAVMAAGVLPKSVGRMTVHITR
jgi:hypothetical protein